MPDNWASTHRHWRALAGACLVMLAPPDTGAPAQEAQAARGFALAERWGSACHVIAPDQSGGDAGPPFATLRVSDPANAAAARAWLFDPHDPMPDLDLAPGQIDDIIAHIRSLDEADP